MKNRVLLIGWDAADWNIIGPLIADGKMPALKSLIDRGVHGNIATMNPPYSPMLWSTIATGKTADEHGVLGFIEIDPSNQTIRPVTTNQRKVRAIWNILHNQGKRSNLVGWWPSFPAEPINGHVVSDKFPKPVAEYEKEWPVIENTFHPKSLENEIKDLRVHPMEISMAHMIPFIPKAREIDESKSKTLSSLRKILSHNSTIQAVSTYLIKKNDWDFTGIYFDMIDHMCHAFMKFHPPKLEPVPEDLFNVFKGVVNGAYIFQDMMLERVLDLVDEDTTVFVMSDHGFESGASRMLKKPEKFQAAPALDHREFGIFVAAGPQIKKKEKVFGLSLIDVTPTLLHCMDLPVGRDMNGSVILDIFENPKEVKYIKSWESVEGDFGMLKSSTGSDPLSEQAAMEQLIELGYIDKPDRDISKAIHKTRCDLQHNLARVYMAKKEFDKAEKILEELLNEGLNNIQFFMELINIHLLQKRYDKAQRCLNQLRDLDKKFVVNTKLLEAKILIGKGNLKKAEILLRDRNLKKDKTGAFSYELGKLLVKLEKYQSALPEFEASLKFKPDNAKYQAAMANCLLRLDRPEEALDHALIAIELMRFFPDAHYLMGEALDKLGDHQNALRAYEMAKSLSPKMKKASIALQNIAQNHDAFDYQVSVNVDDIKGEVIVVSGLPRSGTSMMMQMLDAAGLDILTDGVRTADNNNPKGYYEYEKTKALIRNNSWLEEANGRVLKVVAHLLKYLPPDFRYKVIFMRRDLNEVLLSQQLMLKKENANPVLGIKQAYENELKKVEIWEKKEPGVKILYVNYSEVINNSKTSAQSISDFLELKLDIQKMSHVVDSKLYRNRK